MKYICDFITYVFYYTYLSLKIITKLKTDSKELLVLPCMPKFILFKTSPFYLKQLKVVMKSKLYKIL